ncbi:MAG: DNA-3-methyladenine glycosylase [Anaerolineales bacterium]
MAPITRLERGFFNRLTLDVARDLIGMRLVRLDEGQRISGIIIEAEAYRGEEDLGCHARAGLTPRTKVMYGAPGHAYVYFTYGMHWLLNFVTEEEGFPAAVLIRAIELEEGAQLVAQRRNHQPAQLWTNGPAKLCQALGIDGSLNGYDLCQPDALLFVESYPNWKPIRELSVTSSPRVGLYNVPEPWRSIPWRFVASTISKG